MGSAAAGIHSVAACEQSCGALWPRCAGFIFGRAGAGSCYRRGELQPDECHASTQFDLHLAKPMYSPSPPAPPGAPPSPPAPPASPRPAAVVDLINVAFQDTSAGVLVHQFDSVDVTNAQWGEPWKLSQGEGSWGVKDRISATLVSRRMNWGRGANAGRMPTFSDTFGGFVLSPALLSGDGGLLCSYDHDGGTMQRKCNPVGVSSRCIPGCYREGVNGGSVWCRRGWTEWPCAFRPGDLSLMLETQRNNAKWKAGDPQQWYNELILSERSVQTTTRPERDTRLWVLRLQPFPSLPIDLAPPILAATVLARTAKQHTGRLLHPGAHVPLRKLGGARRQVRVVRARDACAADAPLWPHG